MTTLVDTLGLPSSSYCHLTCCFTVRLCKLAQPSEGEQQRSDDRRPTMTHVLTCTIPGIHRVVVDVDDERNPLFVFVEVAGDALIDRQNPSSVAGLTAALDHDDPADAKRALEALAAAHGIVVERQRPCAAGHVLLRVYSGDRSGALASSLTDGQGVYISKAHPLDPSRARNRVTQYSLSATRSDASGVIGVSSQDIEDAVHKTLLSGCGGLEEFFAPPPGIGGRRVIHRRVKIPAEIARTAAEIDGVV